MKCYIGIPLRIDRLACFALKIYSKTIKLKNTVLYKVKIIIVFALSFLIFSCNGQHNENDKTSTRPQKRMASLTKGEPKEQISQVVRMMFQDSKENLWFGTQNGAFKFSNDSLFKIEEITSEEGKPVTIKDITEDKDGKIWVGHTDGLSCIDQEKVINYYESHGLISNDVWNVETDVKGRVWIGTIGGLCIFDGQKFTNFELPEGEIDTTLGISSTKMVHCIMEDSKEAIWLCTNAGLFKYSNQQLTDMSKKAGIESNFVNEIIESKDGDFYVSTKSAIYKMKGEQLTSISKEIEVVKGAGNVFEAKDGTVWFVFNQHHLYKYENNQVIEFQKPNNNPGPVIFQIFQDNRDRLWFVGYGGAFRIEKGKFVNVTRVGPW